MALATAAPLEFRWHLRRGRGGGHVTLVPCVAVSDGLRTCPGPPRSIPGREHRQVKLLDCPGIVFDDSDAGATLLRNCVDAEAMGDPTPAVAAVLRRCPPEQLMQVRARDWKGGGGERGVGAESGAVLLLGSGGLLLPRSLVGCMRGRRRGRRLGCAGRSRGCFALVVGVVALGLLPPGPCSVMRVVFCVYVTPSRVHPP